jgi:hypothetical protein
MTVQATTAISHQMGRNPLAIEDVEVVGHLSTRKS